MTISGNTVWRRELRWTLFRDERTRAAAIRRAAVCEFPDGKRHPHQYLIPKSLLELAEERLQAAAKRLADAADFDALHDMVQREIGSVHGIDKLMVYDIAHRLKLSAWRMQEATHARKPPQPNAQIVESSCAIPTHKLAHACSESVCAFCLASHLRHHSKRVVSVQNEAARKRA